MLHIFPCKINKNKANGKECLCQYGPCLQQLASLYLPRPFYTSAKAPEDIGYKSFTMVNICCQKSGIRGKSTIRIKP